MCGLDGRVHANSSAAQFSSINSDINNSQQQQQQPPIPAEYYPFLTDAHCHIQDDRIAIQALSDAILADRNKDRTGDDKDERKATARLSCLMGVRPTLVYGDDDESSKGRNKTSNEHDKIDLTRVEVDQEPNAGDWETVSRLARLHQNQWIPSFGIHPWFTHQFLALPKTDNGGNNNHNNNSGGNVVRPQEEAWGPGVRKAARIAANAAAAATGHGSAAAPSSSIPASSETSSVTMTQQEEIHPQQLELSPVEQARLDHYRHVLQLPTNLGGKDKEDALLLDLSRRLPKPRSLAVALKELEDRLMAHPEAILGEIGLDRVARVPEPPQLSSTSSSSPPPLDSLEEGSKHDDANNTPTPKTTVALTSIQHQLYVVREQLCIGSRLDRPVSLHCVQAYGQWLDFLIRERKLVPMEVLLKEKEMKRNRNRAIVAAAAAAGSSSTSASNVAIRSGPSTSALPLYRTTEKGTVAASKKSLAKLKREEKEEEWEKHVAATVQESSDEDEDNSNDGDDDEHQSSSIQTSQPTFMEYHPVLPRRLCMHSFGGSIDMMKAFIKLDPLPEIFFSFSILINGRLADKKLKELILQVPEDRLLIESDHHTNESVDQLLVQMATKIAEIKKWTVLETLEITHRNWHRFVHG